MTQGQRYNEGKPRLSLIPGSVLRAIQESLEDGVLERMQSMDNMIDQFVVDFSEWCERRCDDREANIRKCVQFIFRLQHMTFKNPSKTLYLPILIDAIRVLEFGARKYAANNWRLGGDNITFMGISDSLLRHAREIMESRIYDSPDGNEFEGYPEGTPGKEMVYSGCRHTSHIACNLIFLLYFLINPFNFTDDRFEFGEDQLPKSEV